VNLGIAFKSKAQLPLALDQYRKAIAIDPQHADCHSNLGVSLFQLGYVDEAIHHYSLAVQLEPSHHDALNNLANAYQAGQRYNEAATAYRKAIEIRPNHADLLSNYGNVLHASKQYVQAITAWKHALAVNPKHVNAWYNLGSTLQMNQRLPEAEDAYRQLVDSSPRYAEGWAALGQVLAVQQKKAEAVTALEQAVALDRSHTETLSAVESMPDTDLAHAQAPSVPSDATSDTAPQKVVVTGNAAGAKNQASLESPSQMTCSMVWQCNPSDTPTPVEMNDCSWDTDWIKEIYPAQCNEIIDGKQEFVPPKVGIGQQTVVVVINHLRLGASIYIRQLHESGYRVVRKSIVHPIVHPDVSSCFRDLGVFLHADFGAFVGRVLGRRSRRL
jgi:Tfp pilus assembly protein PilF